MKRAWSFREITILLGIAVALIIFFTLWYNKPLSVDGINHGITRPTNTEIPQKTLKTAVGILLDSVKGEKKASY